MHPLLSMLAFSENEGEALVHAGPDAPAEHVIFKDGKWIGTDGRQLKPWVPRTRIPPSRGSSNT